MNKNIFRRVAVALLIYFVLKNIRRNKMSKQYSILDPGIFSEEGVTICLVPGTDLACRERGFINDPTLSPKETSQALCNYFIDGRFRKDQMPSSEAGLAQKAKEMENWIATYSSYMEPEELDAVKAHYKKVCKK